MLIAEDVMLLMLDDHSGKIAGEDVIDTVLAGGVVAELALCGRLEAVDDQRRAPHFAVHDGAALGDEALDGALARLAGRSWPMAKILRTVAPGLRPHILDRLVQRGLVRREDGRVLGLFPTTSWPAEDSGHEDALRATLGRVLVEGENPDARTAAVIGLTWSSGQLRRVLPFAGAAEHLGVTPAHVAARAERIATGQWAADGVAETVAVTQSAVRAASAAVAGANAALLASNVVIMSST